MKKYLVLAAALLFSGTAHAQFGGTAIPVPGQLQGTATNDSASAGNVGELLQFDLACGSATSLTDVTAKTIISGSITAGDWDVWGTVGIVPTVSGSVNQTISSLSLVTNTLDTTVGRVNGDNNAFTSGTSTFWKPVGPARFSFASTTTVYLITRLGFSTGTMTGCGSIFARRAR